MSSAAQKLMSLDEFLRWERAQPQRYEFADGVVTMMTGGSLAHSIISTNLAGELRNALRGSKCQVLNGDAKVLANGRVYYPDVTVTCTRVEDFRDDTVPEPVLVIEVLSPTTEHKDRSEKKLRYFATPSIRQYAIVEQDEVRLDLYTREDERWTNHMLDGPDAAVELSSVGARLRLGDLYEGTTLVASA